MPSDSATRERAGRVGEADTKREGGEPVGSPAPITLIHRYEDFVMESPEMVTQIESIFKGLSFCIPDWVPYPDEVSEGSGYPVPGKSPSRCALSLANYRWLQCTRWRNCSHSATTG